MAKRYAIWDKVSDIYTTAGTKYTPQEWIERYKWINMPGAVPVISAGMFGASFIGELSEMVRMYEDMGCDFSKCTTNEEKLEVIESYESPVMDAGISIEERTANALEDLVVLTELQMLGGE